MKTNKITIALALMSLLCMATTCDDDKYVTIKVENRTSETIYVIMGCSPEQMNLDEAFDISHSQNFILPDETAPIGQIYVLSPEHENMTVYFLIFKETTLEAYSREELIENDICDKKYKFTYNFLKYMDFIVVYDGE